MTLSAPTPIVRCLNCSTPFNSPDAHLSHPCAPTVNEPHDSDAEHFVVEFELPDFRIPLRERLATILLRVAAAIVLIGAKVAELAGRLLK